MPSPAQRLARLLEEPGLRVMPCCFDAHSARLIERAGFALTFMSGFAVSAARIGAPDTGLISYGEMLDQGRDICAAVSIPVIGDADTGYGNAMNVKRSVRGYAAAGFACVMIEDQLAPKRCGHTRGKQVVERAEALARMRAAVDAREEGADVLVMARTDAAAPLGFEEALVAFPGCAVVISHDRWFLDRIATHILAFEGDSQVVWFEGNYQDYEADRKRRIGVDADQPHRIKYRKLTR